GGVDDVAGGDHPQRGQDDGGGDDPEGDVLGHHLHHPLSASPGRSGPRSAHRGTFFGFISLPASYGSKSGTVFIHSPRRSLSWSRSAMRCSPYSNSGLQNRASNGQTSTQMPQYMQSA